MESSKYVGVDGCTGGWLSIGLGVDGTFRDCRVFKRFCELMRHYAIADLILIDIPIGLPAKGKKRTCDEEARSKIDECRSSVFPAPTREVAQGVRSRTMKWDKGLKIKVVEGDTCRWAKGNGTNSQTFSIAAKTAEVDEIVQKLRQNTVPPLRVREVHPELCFWALNQGTSLNVKKSTLAGKSKRLSILKDACPTALEIFKESCSEICNQDKDTGSMDASMDDILDALAAAVTAYKGSTMRALKTLPKNPPSDGAQLPMEMVYWKPN